jgi:glycosyltransferase 2 family protein
MQAKGVLRLAVTALALGAVVLAIGPAALGGALAGAHSGWAGLAAALLSAQIVLSALRWRLTAAALGLPIPRGHAIGEYYLSVLGNSVLPGGVLGDVGRIARARAGAGLARAAETVVLERVAGQGVLAMAAAFGAVAWAWPARSALVGAVALLGVLMALGLWLRRPGRGAGRLSRLRGRVHLVWGQAGMRAPQAALSLAILACNLGGFWAAAAAVGVILEPAAALLLLPLTLAAMLIPLTVAGWGLREGAAAALWPIAGVAPELAVAASVVFGVAALVAALPGLVALGTAQRHMGSQ